MRCFYTSEKLPIIPLFANLKQHELMHPRTSFLEGSSAEGQPLLQPSLYPQPYLPQASAFVPPPAAPPAWAAPDNAAAEPCPPLTVATVGKAAGVVGDDSGGKPQVDLPLAPNLPARWESKNGLTHSTSISDVIVSLDVYIWRCLYFTIRS